MDFHGALSLGFMALFAAGTWVFLSQEDHWIKHHALGWRRHKNLLLFLFVGFVALLFLFYMVGLQFYDWWQRHQ